MGYKRWSPGSRRDRRRQPQRTRNRVAGGSDKVLFAVAGAFLIAILAILAVLAFTTG